MDVWFRYYERVTGLRLLAVQAAVKLQQAGCVSLTLHMDASQHAVGAGLLQWEEGEQEERPVSFLSRKLQDASFFITL
jgi:hypothetical protein